MRANQFCRARREIDDKWAKESNLHRAVLYFVLKRLQARLPAQIEKMRAAHLENPGGGIFRDFRSVQINFARCFSTKFACFSQLQTRLFRCRKPGGYERM